MSCGDHCCGVERWVSSRELARIRARRRTLLSLARPSPPVSLARRPRLSLIMPAPFRLNTSPRASPRLPQMSTYKAPGAAKAEGEAPQMHRIRITLTSKNVANLEKGA